MLGTAGHVDHGKTAVVKLLTGCDTDTLAEERQRGMTIDLGFAPCRLANERIVGVVDVPGHVDFIRNMVAGAHGIDVVIFVVAADDGVMPQTREHLHILTLMGLRHGVIALTKIDLVEADRRATVEHNIRQLLASTFLAAAPICPLSTVTGEGFEGFFEALNSVVEDCEERSSAGPFRQWVEDVFTVRGTGTIVTGIPSSGCVRPGDPLTLVPTHWSGRVRRLQVYGEDADLGRAGECVALNLMETDHQALRRGLVLAAPDTVVPSTMFEAELELLESFRGELKDGLEVHLHVGTAAQMARVAMLEQTRLTAGQRQLVQFRCEHPLGLVPGDRFVIRANDRDRPEGGLITIGGGRVLGLSNVRLRRNRPWTLAALAARRGALDDPLRWCGVVLQQAGRPLSLAELASPCRMRPEELRAALNTLQTDGQACITREGLWVHREGVVGLAAKILEVLRRFHDTNPKRAGIELTELQTVLDADRSLLALALDELARQNRVRIQGSIVALSGWQAQVSSEEETLAARIALTYREARWAPPSAAELAASLKLPPARVTTFLRLLTDQGLLVRVAPELHFHRDAVQEARTVVLKLFSKAPAFSTMDFRDALGVSRKYAVPLLDYLDSVRFTVRNGNQRTPGAEARKELGGALGDRALPGASGTR